MAALTELILAQDIEGAWAETTRLGAEADGELLPLLGHADAQVRELAVECLARTGSPAAPLALVRALGDPELGVSATAAGGLATLATPDLAPALLVAFDGVADWMVRLRLAKLLGSLDGWAPPLLRKRIDREPHPAVREAMVVALARRGEPEARAEFARWLAAAEPADSPRLVQHAEYISQPWLLRPLLPLLDDWTPGLRLVEGLPGPQHLRVCDLVVDLVCALSGRTFAGAPKPLTNYDLAVLEEVKAYLAALPEEAAPAR